MAEGNGSPAAERDSTAARLERAELLYYPVCPFALPEGDDRDFLLAQELGGRAHKNVSYDPTTGRAAGFRRRRPEHAERLRGLLAAFAGSATRWLADVLPGYAAEWRPDRVSFRPLEEATRRLRLTARNDLLHIDAFPTRPSRGRRLLRLFVNVNPSEPRVWGVSDPFAVLLKRYGARVGLPCEGAGWARRIREQVVGLFRAGRRRTAYDQFMLRLHDFLKSDDDFQTRAARRVWRFAPGSAWLAFTDAVCHAELRGRYALEHSYFVAPETLVCPEEAPAALLAAACTSAGRRAA